MSSKQITIEQLMNTDAYKKGVRIFFHPQQLFEEVINKVTNRYSNSNVHIQVDKESGAGTEDNRDIVTYGRGLISIDINDIQRDGYCCTIGLIWSYDGSKEVIKLYRGVNTRACMNLMISNADNIKTISLNMNKKGDERLVEKNWNRKKEDVMEVIVTTIDEYLKTIEESFESDMNFINELNSAIVNIINITGFIGNIFINECICGTFDYSTFNEACRLLFNKDYLHSNKDLYFVGIEKELPLLKLYQALTQRITDDKTGVDLIPDKTLEITEMLRRHM